MLEVLQFVFSSFWVWAGTVVLISVVGTAALSLAQVAITLVAGVIRK